MLIETEANMKFNASRTICLMEKSHNSIKKCMIESMITVFTLCYYYFVPLSSRIPIALGSKFKFKSPGILFRSRLMVIKRCISISLCSNSTVPGPNIERIIYQTGPASTSTLLETVQSHDLLDANLTTLLDGTSVFPYIRSESA